MPPKKAEAKGKGKGKAKAKKETNMEAGGELDDAGKARLYQLTCQSLQLQLAERTEEATRAVSTKRELAKQVEEMKQQLADDELSTFELTQDMTRQYKGMQEELLSRINNLEDVIQRLQDRLEESELMHSKQMREKEDIIRNKEDENRTLKAKMEDMADEFAEMLRSTLERMRERVEVSGPGADTDFLINQRVEDIRMATMGNL